MGKRTDFNRKAVPPEVKRELLRLVRERVELVYRTDLLTLEYRELKYNIRKGTGVPRNDPRHAQVKRIECELAVLDAKIEELTNVALARRFGLSKNTVSSNTLARRI